MSAVMSAVFGGGAQLLTNGGVILASGKIATFIAGTTTPQATWTDSTQLVQNANPIALDSAGRPPNEIWFQNNTSYKFQVLDANNNVLETIDNIPGINSNTANISEWVAGSVPTYISPTSFSIIGNQTASYTPGRRVQFSVNSGTFYGTMTSSVFGAGVTTVVIAPDSTSLDASLSGVNYGFLNASPSSVPITTGGFVTAQQLQNQSLINFTTTGTGTAFILSPSPAAVANTAGQEFDVTFNATAAAGATVAISGNAALSLVKKTAIGTYVAFTGSEVVNNWRSKVVVMPGTTTALVRDVISLGNNTPTSGSSVLKGDGTGGVANAVAGTDFSVVSSGTIEMWPLASPKAGYLACDGAAVSRATYAALFAVIGTVFGVGDGVNTFNVPNYIDRMPIGAGSLYAAAATGGNKDAVVVSHTHSTSASGSTGTESATHTHNVSDPGHSHTTNLPTFGGGSSGGSNVSISSPNPSTAVVTSTNTTGISLSTETANHTHTVTTTGTAAATGVSPTGANLPPYLGIYFIIKI